MKPLDERKDGSICRPEAHKPAARPWAFQVAALCLAVVTALAATGLAHLWREPTPTRSTPAKTLKLPEHLFADWHKPDLVLLVSGQQHGYLLPCGCSRPQKGGLERRYNLARLLRARFGNLMILDLGDVPQRQGPANLPNVQGLIKYRYAMAAMREIGYSAVGLGEYEAAQPLIQSIGAWALQEYDAGRGPYVVSSNLDDDTQAVRAVYRAGPFKDTPVTVGVASLVGHTQRSVIADLFKNDLTNRPKFRDSVLALGEALKKLDRGPNELRVLLYHGLATSKVPGAKGEAMACAEAFPQFPLVVCLSEEDEAPSQPMLVEHKNRARSMIVALGHKAKTVGVVGVWRTGKADRPFELRYQPVELGEQFLTPADQEKDHPIAALMERYTQELKQNDYLSKYPQRTHDLQAEAGPDVPRFVGSESCKKCHAHAYEVWKKSGHAHAYQTLVEAKRPALRQYDPECIACHTVGFGYKSGFVTADKTPNLKNVGCESCHGPASLHVRKPTDVKWQKLLNPWKAPEKETAKAKTERILRIDRMCQQCHDIDNDVHWAHGGFERKWPLIVHHSSDE